MVRVSFLCVLCDQLHHVEEGSPAGSGRLVRATVQVLPNCSISAMQMWAHVNKDQENKGSAAHK